MSKPNYHARQELMIPPETSALIKSVKILVIGVGAGGNEVLKNLLLMGFGNFTIIDFDIVEDSNLSRTTLFRKEDIGKSKSILAAERLKELALHDNPNIKGLHGNFMTDFGKGLFMEHDIVISCVDTQRCRAFINDWCVRTKTPFFEMGFERYNVNISFFAPTGQMQQEDGKIIDCLPSSDGHFPRFLGDFPVCLREEIGFGNFEERRNSCSGFKIHDINLAKIPTIQVSASMAGTLIAIELVKFLSGIDSIRNKMLFFSGNSYETLAVGYKRDSRCSIHEEDRDIDVLQINGDLTVAELLSAIHDKYNSEVILNLKDSFILSGECHICGKTINYNKKSSEIYDEERWCEDCRKKYLNYSDMIEHRSNLKRVPSEITDTILPDILKLKISQIGIPSNDIVDCMLIHDNQCCYKYIWIKQQI